MSYQGKRHYAYIRSLERLSLERENMQLDSKGKHRGVCQDGPTRRGRYTKKRRLEEQRGREWRERRLREGARSDTSWRSDLFWTEERKREIAELAERLRPYVPESLRTCAPSDERRTTWSEPTKPSFARPKPSYVRSESWSAPTKPSFARPESSSKAELQSLIDMIHSGERNFMDGISYRINPVDTLKMVSASSIFGEPQYYRDGHHAPARVLDGVYEVDELFMRYGLAMLDPFKGMRTSAVMEKCIDEALDADFEATLRWAVELRERYLMRLNPQVILVRAAVHPKRLEFTREHPGEFARIAERVMQRGDDVTNQVQYWLASHGSKQGIPAILKRAWARRIGSMNAYTMAKYGNAGIGLVDVVRICHAKGPLVDTLIRDGHVPMPEGQSTWEHLRSSGMGWAEILSTIRMPHMALLRNLSGIFSEVEDPQLREQALELLKRGVRGGKQFPFRYLSAWKAVERGGSWTHQVQDALEECMGIACQNLPALPGRSAFLSDNSGSAWNTCTSEWGTMHVAEIGNLSSVIGAMRADEGVVFPFGDGLEGVPVHKDEGVLAQANRIAEVGKRCGYATENGIWLFFRDAIRKREHWDNIFVYSDMQAGHGGLYGIDPSDYEAIGACLRYRYIDVNVLVRLYREQVNPKVNVFLIQTAGYTNVLVPEYGYRTNILYGWTGRELVFADAMNRAWDEIESRGPERP